MIYIVQSGQLHGKGLSMRFLPSVNRLLREGNGHFAIAIPEWPTKLLVTDPHEGRAQFIHHAIDAHFPIPFDLDY